jgi:hypothetical protein
MGFLRYYGTVARVAFTHSLSIAQAVIFVLAILVGGVAYFVPKTQAILTPWITGLNGWQVATGVLGAIVFIRLVLAAYWIFKQQDQRIGDLAQRISNPIPDIVIEIRRAELVIPGPDRGVLIVISDVHLTNRSNFHTSIEIRLRLNFGRETLLYPVQNDLPPLFLEESRYEIPSLGQHLPIRIPLGPQQGKYGYLSYTLAENIINFNDLQKSREGIGNRGSYIRYNANRSVAGAW